MDLLEYNAQLIWNLAPFGSIIFAKGQPNILVYDRYATNALSYYIYDNYSYGS